MALIVFAITLFVSAFLLFLVQPMIGKMILPKLGGTPQVWNTCMLFFQTVLLFGYFYTHAATTYLKPRRQMILHCILLIIPIFLMLSMGRPFDVTSWVPPSGSNPIFATLFLLLIVVGLPFFVVSTSAPLLQKWFSFSGDPAAKDPYFLYGASNLGSMLSLAMYPFFVEPWFDVPTQTWIWFFGYIVLVGTIVFSAALVWKNVENPTLALANAPTAPEAPAPSQEPVAPATASTAIQSGRTLGKKKGLKAGATGAAAAAHSASAPSVAKTSGYDPTTAPLSFGRCLRWVLLAALPSSLMLGVTSYVSTDLSPFPLLWAIPLSLYLLSFILVFAKWPIEWTKEPHSLMLVLMPLFAVPALCWVLFSHSYSPEWPTFFSFMSVFLITMALHGELAKDRPTAKNLTMFFLLMSVGGMLGGLFNALIAPVIFKSVIEYPLAIIVACFLRPNSAERGFSDDLILKNSPDLEKSLSDTSDNFAKSFGMKPEGKPFLFSYFFDIAIGLLITLFAWFCIANYGDFAARARAFVAFLGIFSEQTLYNARFQIAQLGVYGPPLLAAMIVSPRALRYALAICGIIFLGYIRPERENALLHADRSYFGVLKVLKNDPESPRPDDFIRDPRDKGRPLYEEARDLPADEIIPRYNYLMHGSTYHGRNYQDPAISRIQTTYYHRFGPVGNIMERYNWFPGKQNTYDADARMPVSMVGMATVNIGQINLPLDMLANVWSEPPFATIGLGTGTMAAYARPFQHMTYYEIDDKIKDMSVPINGKEPWFNYVKNAGDRGADIEIVMGDARLSLEREKEREEQRIKEGAKGVSAMRDGYYRVIVVDAFSSDAIPVHLITKKAIELYMQKLSPDGVLCVHTSNRHLRLIEPVADIAKDLGLDWLVGKDRGGRDPEVKEKTPRIYSLGHFGSEYIMLARKGVLDKKMLNENPIKGYPESVKTSVVQWKQNPALQRPVWTDSYQNIVSIMGHKRGED